MKMRKNFQTLFLTSVFFCVSMAARAADKEIVQLQTQVQSLQDQLSRLQRALDENIGVMSDAMRHNAENVGKLQHSAQVIVSRVEQQNNGLKAEIDEISSHINTLQSATTELKSHLEAVVQRAFTPPVQTQSAPSNVSPSQPPVSATAQQNPPLNSPGSPTETQKLPSSQVPPVQQPPTIPAANAVALPSAPAPELYERAMQHYVLKDYESAENEFTKYLKLDRQSPRAISAQFYLAEIEYQQQDFEGALDDYTDVGPRLSDPAQAATAQYKKALCLLEVEREEEAIRELQALLQRYPHSAEATRAARKVRALQAKQNSPR